MKKLLLLLSVLMAGVSGAWADVSDYISTDLANARWLRVINCSNNSYAMYAKSTTMGTQTKTTTATYSSVQLVAFVGTSSSFKIYSYNLGSSYALKAASNTPENGTTVSWVAPAEASTWTLVDTYAGLSTAPGYGICLSGQSAKSLNMYAGAGNDCKFYTLNEENKGSRWALEIVDKNLVVEDGKVYKISSYQYSTPHTYQIIYSATASQVISTSSTYSTNQGYWVCHVTDGVYTFESAMNNGYYLGWYGVSTTPYTFDLKTGSSTNATTCLSLYSHEIVGGDAKNGRYLYVHKNASSGTNGWNRNSSAYFADGGSTDYLFEEVNASVYKVVSNLNDGGVNYTPSYTGTAQQENNGFYVFSSTPAASDFTAISIANYTPGDIVVDASAKTITVNYTATFTYTLTDENGATYSWSASGPFGTAPTLTGCYGYTLSNEVWNEGSRTYTADIIFPFSVSSNGVNNYTYISSFSGNVLPWYAEDASTIKSTKNFPTNQSGVNDKYKWAIIPDITNCATTFEIKNASTGTYVTSPGTQGENNITLSASGTKFSYVFESDRYAFKIPNTSYYISRHNSSDNTKNLGTWGSHNGVYVTFIEPADFTTLKANLKTAYNTFNSFYGDYNDLIAAGTYTETAPGSMASAHDNNTTVNNVIKDGATDYFTAAQFSTYTNTYNNAVSGVRYVMPTFFRVKNLDGSKYAKAYWRNYSDYIQLVFAADGTDASSIFYLNASNNIMSFYSGLYLFAINCTAPLNYQGYNLSNYKCTYEFLPGTDVNRVYVHTVDNPIGWGGEDKYWSATETQIGRVATPTADSDFLIEEVTALPVTITAAKYATLCAPVALEIPSGVKAYYISNVTKTEATLTKLTGTIPADMPVILYADGLSETTTFNFPITTADAFVGTNILSGQAAAQNVAAGVAYTLQTASNEDLIVGFYPKAAGTIAGFRAYLLASELPADVKGLKFRFDDAVGISTIQGSELMVNDPEIYNIAGQRMSKLQKGVNIVNGKKVLVK